MCRPLSGAQGELSMACSCIPQTVAIQRTHLVAFCRISPCCKSTGDRKGGHVRSGMLCIRCIASEIHD